MSPLRNHLVCARSHSVAPVIHFWSYVLPPASLSIPWQCSPRVYDDAGDNGDDDVINACNNVNNVMIEKKNFGNEYGYF